MRFSLFSSLIVLILLASCTLNEKEQVYIEKIENLQRALDSASKEYYAIDTIQLFKSYDLINMNLSRLTNMDTMISDSIKMYAFMQKTFKKFVHENPIFIDEINYANNQLRTLIKDIRRGRITGVEMENYYFEEMEAVGALISKMQYNAQNIEHQLLAFEQLNKKAERIINTIDNN